MAIATAIMAIGTAIAGVGTVAGIIHNSQMASAQKRASALQERQAEVEAARGRRQAYRDMLKAQAMSETAAAAKGASLSSSLEGGLAQAANSGFQNISQINENLDYSKKLNKIKTSALTSGTGLFASGAKEIGSGLVSLGSSSLFNSGTLFKLGS